MSKYNFDKIIDRKGTAAIKTDGLIELFGEDDLLPLWVADMDFEVCPAIVTALEKRMSHHIYGYSCPSEGYWQSIIDWQGKMHSMAIEREELTYVPGIVRGIALALQYFTEKGDKVVIQQPVYHPFKNVTVGNGRVCVSNDLVQDGDSYRMDLEGLERIFAEERPKMMILCNPHNPIGINWEIDSLRQVAHLAAKYGVKVISDEIHGDLAIFGHSHHPFATVSEEAAQVAITFGAPSKTFNIPGLVSSWCVIKNKELRQGFFHWLEVNEYDSPTWFATIATEAAYRYGLDWLTELKSYIEGNIIAVEEYCREHLPCVHPIRPEASFLVWLDCSALHLCHEKLINLFVNRAHLALNDGEMFGKGGECHMRLNVASPRAMIIEALEQLKKAIEK